MKGYELMKSFGTILFYLGGVVWIIYAVVRYWFGWDVTIRQFLPYHLAAVIPGIILKHGYGLYDRFAARGKQGWS
jgi:hypothetical protein